MSIPERQEAKTAGQLTNEARQANKRRSMRVVIDFPVVVFGQNPNGHIFEEKTKTVTVNAHGALIMLKGEVDSRKPTLLVNEKTGMEIQCTVVYQKEIEKGRFEIGLEFVTPCPRFWGMNFPPEDWKSLDRKMATAPYKPGPVPGKGSNK